MERRRIAGGKQWRWGCGRWDWSTRIRLRGGKSGLRLRKKNSSDNSSENLDIMPLDIEGFIKLAQTEPSLRFLVIGGYAVSAHGFSRMTDDIDFLVNRS